jgi:hypothetical protein
MPKKLFTILLLVMLSLPLGSGAALANNTILPRGDIDPTTGKYLAEELSSVECGVVVETWLNAYDAYDEGGVPSTFEIDENIVEGFEVNLDTMLACAVKSGKIKFWMVPFYIKNILQFLINIAGILAVLMVMVGAFYFIAGGATDDKEKGKTIITYALGGLVLTVLSWFIVNLVLLILTS